MFMAVFTKMLQKKSSESTRGDIVAVSFLMAGCQATRQVATRPAQASDVVTTFIDSDPR
jgi:hypothetical protein